MITTKQYSINEIADILKICRRTVSYRFERLGIKGKRRINKDYFTEEQFKLICVDKNKIANFPLLSDPKYYDRQVLIIEQWMLQEKKSARKISQEFKLPTTFTERTINLFLKREGLIIQSKLNKL